jgi:hypothetical protein
MRTSPLGIAALVFTLLAPSVHAQIDTLWTRTIDVEGWDFGYSVETTRDGGSITCGVISNDPDFGSRSDAILIQSDASGQTVRVERIGEPETYEYSYSVRQTSEGGFILVGSTSRDGTMDIYLVKTDSTLRTEWERWYGGDRADYGFTVSETPDGGYIVAGYTKSIGDGDEDMTLLKTDASGGAEWMNTFGGADEDRGYSVGATRDGGYIVAGSTRSFGAGGYDVYLVKTDASGTAE